MGRPRPNGRNKTISVRTTQKDAPLTKIVMTEEESAHDREISLKLDVMRAELKNHPADGERWVAYGDFIVKHFCDVREAIRAFERAAELLPRWDNRVRLGEALVLSGKTEEGLATMRASIAEKPRSSAYCILASVYANLDMLEKARTACEEAIELDENCEEAYYLLAEYSRKQSREEAIGLYRKAIEIDPDYELAWQGLGSLLTGTDNTLREGIDALKKAVELNSGDGWAWVFLANAYWKADELDDAEDCYQRAIAAYPDYEDIRRWHDQFLAAREQERDE